MKFCQRLASFACIVPIASQFLQLQSSSPLLPGPEMSSPHPTAIAFSMIRSTLKSCSWTPLCPGWEAPELCCSWLWSDFLGLSFLGQEILLGVSRKLWGWRWRAAGMDSEGFSSRRRGIGGIPWLAILKRETRFLWMFP